MKAGRRWHFFRKMPLNGILPRQHRVKNEEFEFWIGCGLGSRGGECKCKLECRDTTIGKDTKQGKVDTNKAR